MDIFAAITAVLNLSVPFFADEAAFWLKNDSLSPVTPNQAALISRLAAIRPTDYELEVY